MTRGHVDSATYRYGCNGRPRPTADSSYITQSGWVDRPLEVERRAYYVAIKSSFGTTLCQYDKSATDTACSGCQHATITERTK